MGCPLCRALESLEKVQVVTVGGARRVEYVAGNDHEVDLTVESGVDHAIVCFDNGREQPVGPHVRQRPKPAKRRAQVEVGSVDECQLFRHEPSVALARFGCDQA